MKYRRKMVDKCKPVEVVLFSINSPLGAGG